MNRILAVVLGGAAMMVAAPASALQMYSVQGRFTSITDPFTPWHSPFGGTFNFVVGYDDNSTRANFHVDSSFYILDDRSTIPDRNNATGAATLVGNTLRLTASTPTLLFHGQPQAQDLGFVADLRLAGAMPIGPGVIPLSTSELSPLMVSFAGGTNFYGYITSAAVTAVPEIGTWAMMLVGLGLVGASLRRRTKVRVSFAA